MLYLHLLLSVLTAGLQSIVFLAGTTRILQCPRGTALPIYALHVAALAAPVALHMGFAWLTNSFDGRPLMWIAHTTGYAILIATLLASAIVFNELSQPAAQKERKA